MRVLIVDDDPDSRDMLKSLVEEHGYPAAVAEDGQVGLETFHRLRPNLVFSDIKMPRMNGLELLDAIRREYQSAIFILVTGFGCEDFAIQALRRGANDYLHKPSFESDFIPVLKRYAGIIEHRSADQEVRAMFTHRSFTLGLDNDPDRVELIAERLLAETGEVIPGDQRAGVRSGLIELIVNVIEHGNLGITYAQKGAALGIPGGMAVLTRQRLAEPDVAARRVTVYFRMDTTT